MEPLSNEKAAFLEAGEALTRVAQELDGKVPGMFWSSTRREIDNALRGALSAPIRRCTSGRLEPIPRACPISSCCLSASNPDVLNAKKHRILAALVRAMLSVLRSRRDSTNKF